MHYIVANPANYGIESYTPVLPSYSQERKNNSIQELTSALETLHSINSEKLDGKGNYAYRLMLPYLESGLA